MIIQKEIQENFSSKNNESFKVTLLDGTTLFCSHNSEYSVMWANMQADYVVCCNPHSAAALGYNVWPELLKMSNGDKDIKTYLYNGLGYIISITEA